MRGVGGEMCEQTPRSSEDKAKGKGGCAGTRGGRGGRSVVSVTDSALLPLSPYPLYLGGRSKTITEPDTMKKQVEGSRSLVSRRDAISA